jgi:type VI secretion system FHA domain protein
LVLPDPTRIVSKFHCVAEGDGEIFRLTDNSRNGVFVNDAEQPIGKGNTVVLGDGDRLRMGDYELEVALVADQPDVKSPMTAGGSDASSRSENDSLIPRHRTHRDTGLGLSDQELDPVGLISPPDGSEGSGLGSLIGEDWDAPPSEPPPGQTPPSAPEEEFFRPPSPAAPQTPIPEFGGTKPGAGLESGPDTPPSSNVADSMSSEAAAPRVARPEAVPVQRGRKAGGEAMFAAFLDGAGLETVVIPAGSEERVLRKVGEAFRHSVFGIMSVLAARRGVKNELRLQQTTIMPADNNPLKFSIGAEEAMENLLLKEGRGYLSMRDSMVEAFDDINAHELALMAGMQEAVRHLLKQIEPKVLEQQADKDRGMGDMLTTKKARYWDTYLRAYERIADMIDEDFDSLLGRYFSRAYEEQIERQRRSRR